MTESRVGFTRLVTSRIGANPSTDLFKQFGIGGYDPTTATANNGGLPQIGFGNGYPTVGAVDWVPTKEYNNVWDLIQNVALSKGAHAYKFGFEFRSVKFPFFQVPDPHGNIGFSQNETAFPSGNTASNGSKRQQSDRRLHGVGFVGRCGQRRYFHHQLRFVAEGGLRGLRSGRLEGKSEADSEPRRAL